MTHTSNTNCLFCDQPAQADYLNIPTPGTDEVTARVHLECLFRELIYYPKSDLIAARTKFKLPKKLKT